MRVFLLCVLLWSTSGLADPAEELYQRLASNASLRADFVQNQFTEAGELIETSRGTVAISKPNKLRWHVVSPFEQLIVSNGIWLWQYDVELEQAVRRPHPENMATSPLMVFVEPLSSVRQAYQVEQQGEQCFALKANDDKSMFTQMSLCFDTADNLSAMRLIDGFGQQTEVLLERLTKDADVNSEIFEFVPPEGIEVVIEEGYVPGI